MDTTFVMSSQVTNNPLYSFFRHAVTHNYVVQNLNFRPVVCKAGCILETWREILFFIFILFFLLNIFGITLINKIKLVSSGRLNGMSYIYCILCSPPKVRFPSIAKYLTLFTPICLLPSQFPLVTTNPKEM